MSPDETKRADRRDMLPASALVAAGLAISGLSLMQIAARNPQMAQATPVCTENLSSVVVVVKSAKDGV
jgi:hypothetical protein